MFSALTSVFWNRDEGRLRALWRLILQNVVMIACLAVAMTASMLVAPLKSFATIAQYVAVSVGIVGSVWLTGRFIDRRRFSDFGVHLNRSWFKDFAFGLGLGAFLMALIFVVEYACGWITVTSVLAGGNIGSLLPSLGAALILFIGVGIHEEFMSRGYHLKNLAEGFSPLGRRAAIALSVLVSSAVFGLLHANNPNASAISTFNIFLAGIFLAAGYILTGELGISIGLHITWNFFQGPVFGFPVSGGTFGPSVFGIEQGGSDVITGGAFGPEAGLIGLAAMLVGTVLIAIRVRMRNGELRLQDRLTKPELVDDNEK